PSTTSCPSPTRKASTCGPLPSSRDPAGGGRQAGEGDLPLGEGGAAVPECAEVAQAAGPWGELLAAQGGLDPVPQCSQLPLHGVELAVVDLAPVHHRPVQVEEADLGGGLAFDAPGEEGVDLQGEERAEGESLRRGLPGLVVGDDEAALVVAVDAVEDPPDDDAAEVLAHVEL